jgi:hypothetical protein
MISRAHYFAKESDIKIMMTNNCLDILNLSQARLSKLVSA